MAASVKVKLNFHPGHLGASASDNGLCLIIRALALKHGKEGEWADKYGTVYEDDLILIHPDWQDEECDCGGQAGYEKFAKQHPCARDCYWRVAHNTSDAVRKPFEIKIKRLLRQRDKLAWLSKASESIQKQINALSGEERRAEDAALKPLRKKYGLPWSGGRGSLGHCSCGGEKARGDWLDAHPHAERCPVVLPNFWHKPTGLKIHWYKYIGRDMKANLDQLSPEIWKQIVSLVTEADIRRVLQKADEARSTFASMIASVNQQFGEAKS